LVSSEIRSVSSDSSAHVPSLGRRRLVAFSPSAATLLFFVVVVAAWRWTRRGHDRGVKVLLNAGADPLVTQDAEDVSERRTPAALARVKGNDECAEVRAAAAADASALRSPPAANRHVIRRRRCGDGREGGRAGKRRCPHHRRIAPTATIGGSGWRAS
jgi:hypothetical protein